MRQAHYDIIIIGTGAGGGTMAHALAATGARILLIERGDFVPQEEENWSAEAVWKHLRYRTTDRWLDERGREFQPYTHYCVGGNTKFWGSVLYRLRREDFDAIEHVDGVSPAWPIDYDTLEPYYDAAERLYHVHGQHGVDPTEAPRGPYPFAPIPHAEGMEALVTLLRRRGLHPSPLPLGLIRPGERDGCVLCNTCNSFPCKLHAKSEADVCCVRPALKRSNVELWTNALARRLITDAAGARIEAVEVERNGEIVRVAAPLFVVSCGAVNSAALLLRSATDRHPEGLANSSGLVGRRYMAHLATMMQGFHPFRLNATVFQKTVAINDFYWQRPGLQLPARADPVPGTDARRDGADRRAVDSAVGVRGVGGARGRLARDVGGPADRRESRHRRVGRAHPAVVPRQQRGRARTPGARAEADPARSRLLGGGRALAPQQEHDTPVRHALLRHRPAHVGARSRTAARTISRTSSSSTPRSSPRRRPSTRRSRLRPRRCAWRSTSARRTSGGDDDVGAALVGWRLGGWSRSGRRSRELPGHQPDRLSLQPPASRPSTRRVVRSAP